MQDRSPVVPVPAATVVVLRNREGQLEVLLVRRNSRLDFHGGSWVFPGGRIDPEDYAGGGAQDDVAAARRAAVREVHEETGLHVAEQDLVLFSRWITPIESPKRFDTWFFAAPATGESIRVDGTEIREHRWAAPAEALAARHAGEIELPPPTFVTLTRLGRYKDAAEALAALRNGPVETFAPRIRTGPRGACLVYRGDAAYDGADVDRPGPRHRLWILGSDWRYERTC